MKRAKQEAWDDLCSQYCAATGKFVIVAQLVKVLNNIKAAVKTDTTATENTSIEDFFNGLQIPTKLSTRYQDINLSIGTSEKSVPTSISDSDTFTEEYIAESSSVRITEKSRRVGNDEYIRCREKENHRVKQNCYLLYKDLLLQQF